MPQTSDIHKISENTLGNDLIIGDIHGSLAELKEVVSTQLGKHDRLFIVGDLTDKGNDSYGVIDYMITMNSERQQAGLEQQIYAIKGNHEILFCKAMEALKKIDPSTTEPSYELANLIHNGGQWVENLDANELNRVQDFFNTLPYILCVEGGNRNDAFNVVHADMPLNDSELKERLDQHNGMLTENERDYAVWARTWNREGASIPIRETGRDKSATMTYCGHTIMGGVRESSNHINLDIGTYNNHQILTVNHSERKCITKLDEKHPTTPYIQVLLDSIDFQLSVNRSKNHKDLTNAVFFFNQEVEHGEKSILTMTLHNSNRDYNAHKLTSYRKFVNNYANNPNITDNDKIAFIANFTQQFKLIDDVLEKINELREIYESTFNKAISQDKSNILKNLLYDVSTVVINSNKTINPDLKGQFLAIWDLVVKAKNDIQEYQNTHDKRRSALPSFFKKPGDPKLVKLINEHILENTEIKNYKNLCEEKYSIENFAEEKMETRIRNGKP